jgi:hypothetical protein
VFIFENNPEQFGDRYLIAQIDQLFCVAIDERRQLIDETGVGDHLRFHLSDVEK